MRVATFIFLWIMVMLGLIGLGLLLVPLLMIPFYGADIVLLVSCGVILGIMLITILVGLQKSLLERYLNQSIDWQLPATLLWSSWIGIFWLVFGSQLDSGTSIFYTFLVPPIVLQAFMLMQFVKNEALWLIAIAVSLIALYPVTTSQMAGMSSWLMQLPLVATIQGGITAIVFTSLAGQTPIPYVDKQKRDNKLKHKLADEDTSKPISDEGLLLVNDTRRHNRR
ncbi:MAG: hypothetical protein AAFR81_13570 [Chloroflexota bacterium]